jgi:hypothetical protein
MRTRFLVVALALIILLPLSSPAFAFSSSSCLWNPIKYRGDAGLFRFDNGGFSGPWRAAATDLIAEANRHPGNFRFDMQFDTFNVSLANGEAEVWWTVDDLWLSGAPAIAYSYVICFSLGFGDLTTYMNENDVLFDANTRYTPFHTRSALIGYGGSDRLMQGTGLHELGHGMQINHVNTIYNIMGFDFTHAHANGNRVDVYWGADASNGIKTLYGARAYEDVSVSHWKYWTGAGEYSAHRRTDVLGLRGGVKPMRVVNGETGYEVSPGETLIVEFTVENNGANCQAPAASFFISSNNSISVSDRRLPGRRVSICPGPPRTMMQFVTIPSDLPVDTPQWLGVMLNEGRTFTEAQTNNNTAYIPLWMLPR